MMSFRRCRIRRRIALVVLLGLLFQQWAMATYVCPLERGDVARMATTSTVPPCHSQSTADKARCHQHCHPPAQSSDHASAPVPPALLPGTTWPHEPGIAGIGLRAIIGYDIDARATAPPLTILHCTFQI